jgi:hypothetical protein
MNRMSWDGNPIHLFTTNQEGTGLEQIVINPGKTVKYQKGLYLLHKTYGNGGGSHFFCSAVYSSYNVFPISFPRLGVAKLTGFSPLMPDDHGFNIKLPETFITKGYRIHMPIADEFYGVPSLIRAFVNIELFYCFHSRFYHSRISIIYYLRDRFE